jgi:hypothetical protein
VTWDQKAWQVYIRLLHEQLGPSTPGLWQLVSDLRSPPPFGLTESRLDSIETGLRAALDTLQHLRAVLRTHEDSRSI